MPILTCIPSFRNYKPRSIQSNLYDSLAKQNRRGDVSQPVLLRLECYLQITDQTLTRRELNEGPGHAKLVGFVGALFSEKFQSGKPTARRADLERFRQMIRGLGALKACEILSSLVSKKNSSLLQESVERFEGADLNEERLAFWHGWSAANRVGLIHFFELHGIHERFGAEFAQEFHRAVCSFQQGCINRLPLINEFSEFLAGQTTTFDVLSARSVSKLVRDFLIDEYMSTKTKGFRVGSKTNQVRTLLLFLERFVFGKIWAEPLPRIPRPTRKNAAGHTTRIRKTSSGHEIKCSLITEIPLHVSDADAMERLFGTIQKDVDILCAWARQEIDDARERAAQRKRSALSGVVSRPGTPQSKAIGLDYRRSRACPEYLAHAAATFESVGFSHLTDDVRANRLYPDSLPDTTWELGLPTPGLLLAHSAILVATHPIITPSFIETLDLYDKDGRLVGLVETDGGCYLVGEKRRRGSELAQQRVHLNPETERVVRDIIELTAPLRAYLKDTGDDSWRKLFLATWSLGWKPRHWRPTHASIYHAEWLAERLQALVGINREVAVDLSKRFSLKRLRSSAAVLVYIETRSVEEMARALGHKTWSPKLLDHYLPRPVQAFFVERWIRIFQMGIICEAMKDSPLLLRATGFRSRTELSQFLAAHQLRRIPKHLENPDCPLMETSSHTVQDRVVFGIEPRVLTVLLSLERAVDAAMRIPSVFALQWARISKYLFSHLDAQQDQPEFHDMVRVARLQADPRLVADLIHD